MRVSGIDVFRKRCAQMCKLFQNKGTLVQIKEKRNFRLHRYVLRVTEKSVDFPDRMLAIVARGIKSIHYLLSK